MLCPLGLNIMSNVAWIISMSYLQLLFDIITAVNYTLAGRVSGNWAACVLTVFYADRTWKLL